MRNRCISMEFAVALSWQGTCAFCHILALVGLIALSSLTGYLDRAEAQGSGVARVEGSESSIPGETSASVEESGVEIFTGVAEQTGIDFVHFNGMSGNYYYPEIIGPGGALFDYDNDGDLDVFLVQGSMLGPGNAPATIRLYLHRMLATKELNLGHERAAILHFTKADHLLPEVREALQPGEDRAATVVAAHVISGPCLHASRRAGELPTKPHFRIVPASHSGHRHSQEATRFAESHSDLRRDARRGLHQS